MRRNMDVALVVNLCCNHKLRTQKRGNRMEKTGIILEGGGLRGVFTAGVVDLFIEKGVGFDVLIGVSAGACHGCSLLSKQKGRAYAVTTDYLDNKEFLSFKNFLKTGDLFGPEMLYGKIPRELYPIDNEAFLKGKTEFYAAVTNCVTGEAEYKRINDLVGDMEFVHASGSLPLVAREVYLNGVPYLDGGIADSVPIRQSEKAGCNKNVVVLTQPKGFRLKKSKALPLVRAAYKNYPKMAETLSKRHTIYNETLDYIESLEAQGEIFVIRPEVPLKIKTAEKNRDKLKKAYTHGYETAEKLYGDMEKYMMSGR